MRKFFGVVFAIALGASLVSAPTALADEPVCDETVRVFSFYSVEVDDETSVGQPVSGDLGGISCAVFTESDGVDGRFIQPGSNLISVTADLSPPADAPPLFGTVTHPDGTVTEIELTPGTFVTGNCCRYRSPSIAIDPLAAGYYDVAIDVVFRDEEGNIVHSETLTDTYRTIGTPSDEPGYLP